MSFSEMRRKDKALTQDESHAILNREAYGVLATIGENGYPYTTPLSFVFHEGSLYFHSAVEGQKIKNVESNDAVSFCVACDVQLLAEEFDTHYKSVILFGRAKEVFEDEKKSALIAFIKKYSEPYLEKGTAYVERASQATRVFKIQVEHLTGKHQSA